MTAWRRWSSARSSDGRFCARSMRSGLSAPTARGSIRCCRPQRGRRISASGFGADLTAAEVHYLMAKEGAQTADDVLWRRSKLGLRFTDAQRAMLDRFMAQANA